MGNSLIDFFEIELISEPIQICRERLVTPPLLLPAVSSVSRTAGSWAARGLPPGDLAGEYF
jgi:hypothetical protein